MTASHQIPADVLANIECITIIPAMAKAAVVVGGAHGTAWSAAARVQAGARRAL